MTTATQKLLLDAHGEPRIDQGLVHGNRVTFNPDDGRFYVERPTGETWGTFAAWRNVVQFCRKHMGGAV